jgi:hypothetical protein
MAKRKYYGYMIVYLAGGISGNLSPYFKMQSRAEQSRAEQSRAEQSAVVFGGSRLSQK